MTPTRMSQCELVEAMREPGALKRYPKIVRYREIRETLTTGRMFLREEQFAFAAVSRAPQA